MAEKEKPECCIEHLFKFDICGEKGPQGKQGSQGRQGSQGQQGPQGQIGSQGSQGPQGQSGSQGSQGASGITTSPLLFGGLINYFFEGGGSEEVGRYYTFGAGYSSFLLPPPTIGSRGKVGGLPLQLPIQFTSSNLPAFPATQPSDIYFRVPGFGTRTLSNLRFSLEYALDDAFPIPNIPAVIGIWTGNNMGIFGRPTLSQSALASQFLLFNSGASVTKFQEGQNQNDSVQVVAGSYIALVLLTPGSVGSISLSDIYVTASVDLA